MKKFLFLLTAMAASAMATTAFADENQVTMNEQHGNQGHNEGTMPPEVTYDDGEERCARPRPRRRLLHRHRDARQRCRLRGHPPRRVTPAAPPIVSATPRGKHLLKFHTLLI